MQCLKKSEVDRRLMEKVFHLMRRTADEEMKMLESQNLYEATRNEHALYSRHILHLKV